MEDVQGVQGCRVFSGVLVNGIFTGKVTRSVSIPSGKDPQPCTPCMDLSLQGEVPRWKRYFSRYLRVT
jgi:hypothetical protein